MSNATQDSRGDSGERRRRRSRGGSNRNRNHNHQQGSGNERRNGGDRGARGDSRDNPGQSQHRGNRSEEFRPQAPRPARTYAPAKLTLWQKILKAIGLYKEPAPPSRYDRQPQPEAKQKPATESRPPKSNTRNARSGEAESREARPPREKRPEGEAQPRKERAPRADRPKGGDGKSVESTRVYVGNLSYDVTEQDLQELFKGIGGVRNVEIVYNRSTHRSKGYGFVEMLRLDEAIRAVEVLHDQHFMGRKMTVSGAKSKGQDERDDKEPERTPMKVVLAPLPTAEPIEAATESVEIPAEAAAASVEVVAVTESPVKETSVEPAPQEEPVTATELESKYSFDAPKEKTEGA